MVAAIASPAILEAFRQDVETFRRLFGDHRVEITDMVAEGDRVWVRADTSGGHTSEWLGIPPTGKRWSNPGAFFYRLAGGRIAEEQWVFDALSHVRQLGATLTPPATAG